MQAGTWLDEPVDSRQGDAARAWLSSQGDAILETQLALARTPAPPFGERTRSELIASKLGAEIRTEFDEIGNLLAPFPTSSGDAGPAPIIVAAHVDTVFGPEVPIHIRRVGDRWVGPGIVDNARGLAVTITVARALVHGGVEPRRPILFAFTVGEEGSGDLRGVKHMFRDQSSLRTATAFIAVDGGGTRRIIHHALASRRFRFVVRGAGGHSWTDWGRSNPAAAIGEFIHRLSQIELPEEPRTTLTVARFSGGTSINAIPVEGRVELDLRSESSEALSSVESRVMEEARAAIAIEEARGEGSLGLEIELIGERPAGELPISHPLVRVVEEATRALGNEPEYAVSSTDANVPMSLRIPAISIGGGGRSGDTHSENEWFENSDGATGALRLLSTLASTAGF